MKYICFPPLNLFPTCGWVGVVFTSPIPPPQLHTIIQSKIYKENCLLLGVTTMLNFFTTSNGFRSTLPVVSNLTAMNVWDGVCMCFIYASLLEFVCVNYVGRKRPLHNVVYRPGENPVTQVNYEIIINMKTWEYFNLTYIYFLLLQLLCFIILLLFFNIFLTNKKQGLCFLYTFLLTYLLITY